MKLKEAFRAQNCLSNLYEIACDMLSKEAYEKKTTTHQLSNAGLGEDKIEEQLPTVTLLEGTYDFDKQVNLAMALAQEKEKLIVAIEKAKLACDVSFDGLKQTNTLKQSLIYRLSVLNNLKTTEKTATAEFYGKDNDGKQAIFTYPIKEVYTYDFDKTHLKAIQKRLKNECEETSLKLDQMLVNIDVDYNCRFDYDSCYEDIYLEFEDR